MRRYHLPKTWPGLVCAVAAIAALSCSASAVAQTVTEFPIPTANSVPKSIAAGPDGALWFTEFSGNKIGRITTGGVITEFSLPKAGSTPYVITAGPDGALWFVELNGDNIGRITTAGVITEFPILTGNSRPSGITVGPDGALWFTEFSNSSPTGNTIGRITTSGVITEFPLDPGRRPSGITVGPDGALWFTEFNANNIGRIATAGVITEFPIPTTDNNPLGMLGITVGPDGALWFTEQYGNKIGRITTSGVITEFPLPTADSSPRFITVGPDGALWFAESVGSNIGRITTTGVITEFKTPGGGPEGITAGPDGALWFTEGIGNIGRLSPPAATSPLLAATLPSSRSVQVGGNVATAFAVILNTGAAATGCGIAPVTSVPATFSFQTTDPNTNTLTGTPDTRVPIAAGASQTFLVAYSANAPYPPTDVVLGFDCTNVGAVATIVGVNTLLLTFDANPVPDMIAVGLTPSKDGYSRIPGPSGTGIFVIAATNIGVGASLTARVRLLTSSTPLTATLCETDPNNSGQCKMTPAPTDTRTINHNENTTWTAFLQANGAIAQDAARFRVMFEFVDANGVIRGSTSTAVTTQ
jgi:virginiamycin B lyase